MASALNEKLSRVQVCRGLTPIQVEELAALIEETQASRGTVLFSEGERGDFLLVVTEGTVDVTKSGQTLASLGDGSVLGEMSLVSNGETRSATATAVTDVKLLKLPSAKFQALLKQDNLAALKVVSNLSQVLSKRLSGVNEKLVASMGQGKKKEELADFQRILSDWTF